MAKYKFYDGTQWVELAKSSTTLAGYGITDAKIENGVITLGSNTITPITSHYTNTLTFYTKSGNTSSQILKFDQSANRSITFKGSGTVSVSAVSSGNTSTEVTITGTGGSASQATTNSLGTIKVLATRGSGFNSSAINYGYGNSNGGDEWNYSLGICYGVELTSGGKAFIRVCKNFWIHNIVIESSSYRISFQFINDNDYYPYTSFAGIAYDMYYYAQSLPASGVAGSGKYVYKVGVSGNDTLIVYYQSSSGSPSTLTLSSSSGYTITDTVQEIHGAPTYRS